MINIDMRVLLFNIHYINLNNFADCTIFGKNYKLYHTTDFTKLDV